MGRILPAIALSVLAASSAELSFAQQLSAQQRVPGQYYPELAVRPTSARSSVRTPLTQSRAMAAWNAVASMTVARGQHAAQTVGGKIYVWGGYLGAQGGTSITQEYNSLEVYTPSTNAWSAGAPYPIVVRGHASAVGADGQIYSFGGASGAVVTSSYRYTPATNTWTAIAALPVGEWMAAAATGADGRIYVFGGFSSSPTETRTQIYNPTTNTWTTGADMPAGAGRHGHMAVRDANGLIHIIGGTNSSTSGVTALTSHLVYNPTTDTWLTRADLPVGVNQGGATLGADGNIYVIGGKDNYINNNPNFFNTVYVYNPGTNTWSAGTSLPIQLAETKAVSIGADIYTLAGANGTMQAVAYRSTVAGNITWTGATSTNWDLGSNWSGGAVPTVADNVTIPAGLSRYPVVSSTLATASAVTISSGASLSVNTGGTLTLAGNFVNNGTFTATGTATVALSGTAAQAVGGSSSTRFRNLTVGSPGASLAGQVEIQRLLTLNGNLATNGQRFVILSNDVATGMVVNNGGVVTGNATVQRYIEVAANAGFGYRHYSAPVGGATLSNLTTVPVLAGAQAPGPIQINPDYNSAADPGGVTPFPTIFSYSEGRVVATTAGNASFDQGWLSPTPSNQALTPGLGFTINQTAGNAFEVTGTGLTSGAVTQAGLTRGSGAESGWQLLGNPYPSPIDWNRVGRSNVEGAAYVYRSTGQYDGGYTAYVNGVGTNILPLGQAFFVRVSAPGAVGSVSFTNAARETSYQDPSYARPAQTETRPLVQLQLQRQGQSGPASQDDFYVYEQAGASVGFDGEYDAVKVQLNGGQQPSLYQVVGNEGLAIQGLPVGSTPQRLNLGVHAPVAGSYVFSAAQLLNLPTGEPVYLEDKLSGSWQDLRQGSYTVSLQEGRSTTRFVLHLHEAKPLATGKATAWAGEVQLYPNPANSVSPVTVVASGISSGQAELVLVNSLGQQVWQHTAAVAGNELRTQVPVAGLAAGIYTLQLRTAAGLLTRKLVVE